MVITAARNPYKEAQRDVLPGGAPNSPVRRISYNIAHALTLHELAQLVRSQRHKASQGIWKSKHEAAVLIRAANLVYYKALAGERSPQLVSDLEVLLRLSAEVAPRSRSVTRQLEGSKMRQLLASCARLGATVPRALSDAILAELLRDSGNKLPSTKASHMAELVWALATVRAGFQDAKPQLAAVAVPPAGGIPNSGTRKGSVSSALYTAPTCNVNAVEPATVAHHAAPRFDTVEPAELAAGNHGTSRKGQSSRKSGPIAAASLTDSAAVLPQQQEEFGPGPGPGAPRWAADGIGSPLAWSELQRCALLSLQVQKQRQQQRRASTTTTLTSTHQGEPGGTQPGVFTAPPQEDDEASASHLSGSGMDGRRQRPPTRGGWRANVESLSQMAWAFAVAGRHDAQLFSLVEELAAGQPRGLQGAQPSVAADMVFAFARASRPCPRLLPQLCAAFTSSLQRLLAADKASSSRPSSGSNADLAQPSSTDISTSDSLPETSQAMGAAPFAAGGASGLPKAPQVAQLVWATAVLQYKDPALLDAVAAAVANERFRFTADGLAHVAWAFTQHQHYVPEAYESLAKLFVSQKMYGISNAQLAMLASSFAQAGHVNVPLRRTIARLAAGRLDTMPCKDLVSLVCSLAKVEERNDLLLEAAAKAAIHNTLQLGALAVAELSAVLQLSGAHSWRAELMLAMSGGRLQTSSATEARDSAKGAGALGQERQQVGLTKSTVRRSGRQAHVAVGDQQLMIDLQDQDEEVHLQTAGAYI